MRCEGPRTGLQRPLLILSRWEPLAGNQRGLRRRGGVGRRGEGGHELFHLRRRGALTSAYMDANQKLEPLPRQVGRAAAGQVGWREEGTKWNLQKQNKAKQNRSSGSCCELEKINNEDLEGFQGTHLQVQRPWRQQRARAFLLASPANVSPRCVAEDCF